MELGSFSLLELLGSFVFSVIGLYYFQVGKKDTQVWIVILGLCMMIYPYFVSGELATWLWGGVLWATAIYLRH